MVKRRWLLTRSLGAEPVIPDKDALSAWVAQRRGFSGDLISYHLGTSLSFQKDAGITHPCAGGMFYRDRLLECFSGINDGALTGETGILADHLSADAAEITSVVKGGWCAFPAPHALQITDKYFGDEDEMCEALVALYRDAMRTMRDGGINGHVLICTSTPDVEFSALARQKVFFFHPSPLRGDLEILLEYQPQVAIRSEQLDLLMTLSGEYDFSRLILLDPDRASITRALSCLDPDQIMIGGYCTQTCDAFWMELADRAFYTL